MALEQNFSEFSGNDLILKVSVVDEVTHLPLNLTGAQSLIWALGRKARSQPLLTKAIGSGLQVTNAANGQVEIELSSVDTEPLRGIYYHEMRLVNAAGKVSTLMYGAAEIQVNLIRN